MKSTILGAFALLLVATGAALAGNTAPTPEPGSFYLLGTAVLGGAGYVTWKKFRR